MIRRAHTSDIPRLVELVTEMHGESEFAARGVPLSLPLVRSFVFRGIRNHGGKHEGSTLFNVIEFRGQVEAFMLGLLQPVYCVCDGLESQDFWLYASRRAPKLSAARLVDAYLEWAVGNPRVVDIGLSWTDVVGVDGRKIAKLYERKGFRKRGEIFVRTTR